LYLFLPKSSIYEVKKFDVCLPMSSMKVGGILKLIEGRIQVR
jgi:hypothetical protein